MLLYFSFVTPFILQLTKFIFNTVEASFEESYSEKSRPTANISIINHDDIN